MDKYGDYGFAGFFVLRNTGGVDSATGQLTSELEHYCFSCRILGMHVEIWLYDRLHRPRIIIAGEVLSDLSAGPAIDWIRIVQSHEESDRSLPVVAPEIRIHGGCEVQSIAHYLEAHSPNVVATGNFHAGRSLVRVNSASLLLSACDRSGDLFEREAAALGIPYQSLVNPYFENVPTGTVFIFGGQMDNGSRVYGHKVHQWQLYVEPHGLAGINLVETAWDVLKDKITDLGFDLQAKAEIARVARHIHENYDSVSLLGGDVLEGHMRMIFGRVPQGSKFILVLDHDRIRLDDGTLLDAPWVRAYADCIKPIADPYPFVGIVSFADVVLEDQEIHVGGNHYDRMVYHRMAERIVRKIHELPPKTAGSDTVH
jgi:hypothetical protein